jgi:hypothetical protein
MHGFKSVKKVWQFTPLQTPRHVGEVNHWHINLRNNTATAWTRKEKEKAKKRRLEKRGRPSPPASQPYALLSHV